MSQKSILLNNCAISTSGDLHQFVEIGGKRYSHIINGTTGLGMTRRASATVIAPEAILSDMYATGACLSLELAKKLALKSGEQQLAKESLRLKGGSVLRVELIEDEQEDRLVAFKSGLFSE